MTETGIHVGSGGSKHKLKRVLLTVGVVLLVAAAAVGIVMAVRWWQHRPADSNEAAATPEGVQTTIVASEEQLTQRDYDGARETIDMALTNPELSVEGKYSLYMQRALVYVNQQNYEAALKDYQTAESYHESVELAEAIASLAMRMDNKELALAYYKKTLELLPQGDTDAAQMNRQYFENWVTYLEGGEVPQNE
jgi:tetratricopeptide (TPR) repeat protein